MSERKTRRMVHLVLFLRRVLRCCYFWNFVLEISACEMQRGGDWLEGKERTHTSGSRFER